MRHDLRQQVLGDHLHRVHARRADLRRVLSGGAALVVPTLHEKQGFEEEYARLGPVEAALAARLPPRFEPGRRRVPQRLEAAVLSREREFVATEAMPLLQREVLDEEEERALDLAIALFGHCTEQLQRIADDVEALRQARLLEGRLPRRRVGDGGVRTLIGVGGWALFVNGRW